MPKKTPKTFAFLDTNVLLEYKEYTQIDWLKLLESREVCLVIAPIVFDELDDKKTSQRERHRETARKLLPKLFRLTKGQTSEVPVPERPNTTVLALSDPADLSIELRLKARHNDDHLIASILHFQRARPSERVVLLAADYGCLQRASTFGLEALEMPEEELREDPPNPERKQIAQLKEQVANLENLLAQRYPQLDVDIYGLKDGCLTARSSAMFATYAKTAKGIRGRIRTLVDKIKSAAEESETRRELLSQEDGGALAGTVVLSALKLQATIDNSLRGERLSIGAKKVEAIRQRLRGFGLSLSPEQLQPKDVYNLNSLTLPFQAPLPGGSDVTWYRLIQDLDRLLKEGEREIYNAHMQAVHFPISVQLAHKGGPAAQKLEVFLRGATESPLMFSYFIDEKEEPKEESYDPLGIRVPAPTMIYPRVEYRQYTVVDRDVEIIKPGTTSKALKFYVLAPPKAGRFEAEVEVVGENLASPIIERFYIEFDKGQSKWS